MAVRRLQTCIMCGSRRLRRQRVTVNGTTARSISVLAEVCPDCGERYYDLEAMRRIEAARLRRNGRVAKRRCA